MAEILIRLKDTPDGPKPFSIGVSGDITCSPLEPPTEVQRLYFDFAMAVSRILNQDEPTDLDDEDDDDELIDPTDTWVPDE